jgi:hypothetical protein
VGRHVVYESRLELARLLLADLDPRVRAIAAQPFHVAESAVDGARRHVPDFLLVDDHGVVTVVNVKPADRLTNPRVAASLGWAGKVFAERGWLHEIWSGAPAAVLANVRFLSGYRHGDRVDGGVVGSIEDTVDRPVTLDEVVAARPEPAVVVRSAVLHLVWRGVFRADLTVPLSGSSVLERAA